MSRITRDPHRDGEGRALCRRTTKPDRWAPGGQEVRFDPSCAHCLREGGATRVYIRLGLSRAERDSLNATAAAEGLTVATLIRRALGLSYLHRVPSQDELLRQIELEPHDEEGPR